VFVSGWEKEIEIGRRQGREGKELLEYRVVVSLNFLQL
jgi:hypothetical protein